MKRRRVIMSCSLALGAVGVLLTAMGAGAQTGTGGTAGRTTKTQPPGNGNGTSSVPSPSPNAIDRSNMLYGNTEASNASSQDADATPLKYNTLCRGGLPFDRGPTTRMYSNRLLLFRFYLQTYLRAHSNSLTSDEARDLYFLLRRIYASMLSHYTGTKPMRGMSITVEAPDVAKDVGSYDPVFRQLIAGEWKHDAARPDEKPPLNRIVDSIDKSLGLFLGQEQAEKHFTALINSLRHKHAVGKALDFGTELRFSEERPLYLIHARYSDGVNGYDVGVEQITGLVGGFAGTMALNLSPSHPKLARDYRRLERANRCLRSLATQILPLSAQTDANAASQAKLLAELLDTYIDQSDAYLEFMSSLTAAIRGFNAAGTAGYEYLNDYGYRVDLGGSFSWQYPLKPHGRSAGLLFQLSTQAESSNQRPAPLNAPGPTVNKDLIVPRVSATIAYQNEVAYLAIDNRETEPFYPSFILKTWTVQYGIEYLSRNEIDATESINFFVRYRDVRHHIEGLIYTNIGFQQSGYLGIGIRHSFGL